MSERNRVAPPKGGSESSKRQTPQSSSEETRSESEESNPQIPQKPVVAVGKPKSKKNGAAAASSATPTPASKATSIKRKAEREGLSEKDAKKKKADTSLEADGGGGDDSKKNLFQKIWSEADELAVLRGMIDFMNDKMVDPSSDLSSFHEIIKDKIEMKATKDQIRGKIIRWKTKFATINSKGEDHVFPSPHDRLSYQLCKALWGNTNREGPVGVRNPNVANKEEKVAVADEAVNTAGADSVPEKEKVAVADEALNTTGADGVGNATPVSHLLWNLSSSSIGSVNMEEVFHRVGMEIFQREKAVEISQKWMDLRLVEMEHFAEMLNAKSEKAKLIMDELKSRKV